MADLLAPRKDQIHRSACTLFHERGFHGTSVRDIADAVGLQGGSLYAHMACKEDLLWDIVDAAGDRFFDALRPIVSGDLNPVERLRRAIVAHVGVITNDLDAAAVYTMEWRHLKPEHRAAAAARRDEYEILFRSLVDDAIKAGFIDVVDSGSATLFMLSAMNWVFTWFRHDGAMTSEEVGGMLADYVFDGLRRRSVQTRD